MVLLVTVLVQLQLCMTLQYSYSRGWWNGCRYVYTDTREQ